MPRTLKLGTRGSELALTQSRTVAAMITAATGNPVELVVMTTRGDRIQDRPLPEIGGKGLFTQELESALLKGEIDLAVHSLKDLPTEDPDGLTIGAIPERADPRDALVGRQLERLGSGEVVATGSLRRRMQLLSLRNDVVVRDIRGNVPTRLAKRDKGECAATILAMAGLARLQITRDDIWPLEVEQMIPAVGQGALGIQCRSGDPEVVPILASIDDLTTRACVEGERSFLRVWGGGCNVPAAAHITKEVSGFRILAVVEGSAGDLTRFEAEGEDPLKLGHSAAQALRSATDL